MKMTKMSNGQDFQREWIVLDAEGEMFGRIITKAASILRGKHKPIFTPHIDTGDYVIIINATKAKFTGNKLADKEYFTHSGYFGSTKSEKMESLLNSKPEKLYKLATRGMLPKTKLGKAMLKKLKIYAGAEHPHTAQVNNKESN